MTTKLAKASMGSFDLEDYRGRATWSSDDIDKMEAPKEKDYQHLVKECRFFYRKDPIGSTVLNKLVEIGITELKFNRDKLSDNEYRIFTSLQPALQTFAKECALEYLISGLVIPEFKLVAVSTDELKSRGIKKYGTLLLPGEFELRDPETIKINSVFPSRPSYYWKIPENLVFFISNGGIYPDGTEDKELYAYLLRYHPEFVSQVKSGKRDILLDNPLILRRKFQPDSPYPIPYLSAALEPMKHKRNLRRMDYSIAARAIGAIQQFAVGNDDYPLTEEDSSQFDDLKNQMLWRDGTGRNVERIFQLFTNHTVAINWVYPPLDALLDDRKYLAVNDDIFFALGFPRILTTGESQRTGTSDPEFATLSPVKTMEEMQSSIRKILQGIVVNTAKGNKFQAYPEVSFSPIDLHAFKDFVDGLRNLYDTGNLSRETYLEAFGYDFETEMKNRSEEKKTMKEFGLEEFAPKPFSPQPDVVGDKQDGQEKPKENKEKVLDNKE